MNKLQKQLMESKNILTLFKKTGQILLFSFLILNISRIGGTNAFFADKLDVEKSQISSGVWIPKLEMTVDPASPDGDEGWYKTEPCLTLKSSVTDKDETQIYYRLEDREDHQKYNDECIQIPNGEWSFSAYAIFRKKENWKSNLVEKDFKVDTSSDEEGDVVINEIMWMGSLEDSDDEWIELRNMTNHEIDLSNWDIQYAGSGKSGHVEIPHGYSIKAKDYFLITAKREENTEINLKDDLDKDEGYTHVSGMNLKNSGEPLILKDKNKNVIDEIWKDSTWPAGWHGTILHMSMERDSNPGDGTKASNWNTCTNKKCNDKDYWRKEGANFGTPGKKNLGTDNDFWDKCKKSEEDALTEATEDGGVEETSIGEGFLETQSRDDTKEKPVKVEINSENGKEDSPNDKQYSASIVELEDNKSTPNISN